MNKGLFITGTDTGIGKTLVTGLLAKAMREIRGLNVATQKWVQTGSHFAEDLVCHHVIMGLPSKDFRRPSDLCPYIFNFPASPHLAASLEGKTIQKETILKSFKKTASRHDFVLVEGTGGLLVPYSKNRMLADIATLLSLEVIVVAGNKLGAISHTLLTLEELKRRKMKVRGIIFNNFPGQKKIILEDNVKTIESMTKIPTLGILPFSKNRKKIERKFPEILKRLGF